MNIIRQNYVATMNFYVATLPKKFLKKNVATLFLLYLDIDPSIWQYSFVKTFKPVSRHKRTEEGRNNVITQQNYVTIENGKAKRQDKSSLSRQRFLCCDKHFKE